MNIFTLRFLNLFFVGTIAATTASLACSSPAFSQSEENPIPLDVEIEPGQSPTFWPAAQTLTQSQIHLLSRVEEAFATPDPNRVRATRGQIILYLGQIDRFLETQALQFPNFQAPNAQNCGTVFYGTAKVSAAQRLNCHLYGSLREWEALLPLLDSRLAMLATIADVRPLPLVTGESVMGLGGIPTLAKGSLREPAPSLTGPLPAVEPVSPPLGRPVKSALGDYRPPLPPAVAPLGAGIGQLNRLESQQMKPLFPAAFADFVDRATLLAVRELPADQDPDLRDYVDLLAEPHTGIASIRREEAPPLTNPVANSLANRLAESASPFVPLLPPTEHGFQPTLKLEVATSTAREDHLAIVTPDLDYGFLVPLGDVPVGSVSPDLNHLGLNPEVQDFILNYQPPRNLEALQVDRRRFLTGKQAAFLPLRDPLPVSVPLQLQQTYLLRSLQFHIPPLLRTRQFTASGDRRYMAESTTIDSSDLLIAVRPIARRSDGSYRLVWKILREYPNPELENLWEYID